MYGRTRLWAAPGLGMAPWWGVIGTPDDRRQALEGRQSYGIRRRFLGTVVSYSTSLSANPDAAHGGVTACTYLNLSKKNLPAIMGDDSIFMQDNAPVYTARKVYEWLREMGYRVLPWPPILPRPQPYRAPMVLA